MLDRLFTYFQLSGDFLKGAGDTSQNLNLAGRQLVGSTFLLAEHCCTKLGRYIGHALADALEDTNKFFPLNSLEDASANPNV